MSATEAGNLGTSGVSAEAGIFDTSGVSAETENFDTRGVSAETGNYHPNPSLSLFRPRVARFELPARCAVGFFFSLF